MTIDDIKTMAVIGAGNMGHQIALHCAIMGYKVACTDLSADTLAKAEEFVASDLPGRVEKGRLTQEQADAARANIRFTRGFEDAVRDADYGLVTVLRRSLISLRHLGFECERADAAQI